MLTVKGALEECLEAQRLDIGSQVQILVGQCLQRDSAIHLAKLAKQQKDDVLYPDSGTIDNTETSDHEFPAPRRKKGSRRRALATTHYRYRFFGVKISVIISSHSDDEDRSSKMTTEKESYTWTSVSMNLSVPMLKRGLGIQLVYLIRVSVSFLFDLIMCMRMVVRFMQRLWPWMLVQPEK